MSLDFDDSEVTQLHYICRRYMSSFRWTKFFNFPVQLVNMLSKILNLLHTDKCSVIQGYSK